VPAGGNGAGAPPGATPADPGDVSETRLLLQAVPVLTLGDHIGQVRPPPGPPEGSGGRLNAPPTRPEVSRTLTLALTPEETEAIALGRTLGTLELALRNPEDADVSKRQPITLKELRGASARSEAEPPPVPVPGPGADARRPIELIVGSEHRTIYSLDAGLPHRAAGQGTMRPSGTRGP